MEQLKTLVGMVKENGKAFINEEDGVGVVEIILILVVLVGLVIVFKDQITGIVQNALASVQNKSNQIMK